MTTSQLLAKAAKYLQTSSSPQLDAEILLAYVLHQTRTVILANSKQPITLLNLVYFYWLVQLRRKGWPVAYLTHHKEFYGRSFKVTAQTLIPRPSTELLIEKTLGIIRARRPVEPAASSGKDSIKTIADIGTGSGCIAITLALAEPYLKIYATDNSSAALKVAKQNAQAHGVTKCIDFGLGNLVESLINRQLDIVVANLPYVTNNEYTDNPDLKFEPKDALLEQPGLFSNFCEQISAHKEIKYIFLETSPQVLDNWLETLKKYYPANLISILPDLSGSSRLIMVDNAKTLEL